MGKRLPFLITGWFWYVVTLLPVIGLIHIGQHSIADRYTYIPLIGLFLITAWGIPRFLESWQIDDEVRGIVLISALIVLINLTLMQLQHWKNSYTLFTHAIDVTENNWMAHNNLGLVLLGDGRVDEAIPHFKESLKAKPSYVLALLNLGVAYSNKGEQVTAMDSFKQVLHVDPDNPKAHLALGLLYVDMGEKDLALEEYRVLDGSGSPFTPYLLNRINAMSAGSAQH